MQWHKKSNHISNMNSSVWTQGWAPCGHRSSHDLKQCTWNRCPQNNFFAEVISSWQIMHVTSLLDTRIYITNKFYDWTNWNSRTVLLLLMLYYHTTNMCSILNFRDDTWFTVQIRVCYCASRATCNRLHLRLNSIFPPFLPPQHVQEK
jgi:hypothetical protein